MTDSLFAGISSSSAPFKGGRRHFEPIQRVALGFCGIFAAAVFISLVLVAGPSVAQEDGPPDREKSPGPGSVLPDFCVTALKANAEALQTASLSYTVKTESEKNPRSISAIRSVGSTTTLQLAGGRFFAHTDTLVRLPDGTIQRGGFEMSFDGTVFYSGTPPQDGGVGSVQKYLGENLDDPEAKKAGYTSPYLEYAGILIPFSPIEWKEAYVTSAVLHAVSTGKLVDVLVDDSTVTVTVDVPDKVVQEGKAIDLEARASHLRRRIKDSAKVDAAIAALRRLKQMAPERRIKFVLDRSKSCAVLSREEFTTDGRRIQSIACQDLRRIEESQLWLPNVCAASSYVTLDVLDDFSESPLQVTTITLDRVSLKDPDRDSFEIAYQKAGSVILDRSTKASKDEPGGTETSIVPATAEDLRNAAKAVRGGTGWRTSTIVIAVNVALLLIVAVGFGYSKYRR